MQATNLALQAGRQLQKKQTGFVHYCYQSEDGNTHETIPVLENALFSFSLFRSRLSDHVLEGKALIEKLLPFEVKGNFPVYLHEYPRIQDPYLGMRLLPIFFWIVMDFGHVIGDLKPLLNACIERILTQLEGCSLPSWALFRLAAFKGQVEALPLTLYDWSEALISLQIAEKKGACIKEAVQKACQLWHPDLQLYVGPALRRHQQAYEPEVTLFDLFMSQWQKTFSERVLKVEPIHLRGALIRPLTFEVPYCAYPTPFIHFDPEEECPLWIAWDKHTFVLAKRHLKVEGSPDDLFLYFGEEEEEMPVNFYLNHHRDHAITINGQKATAFEQGDTLEIDSNGLSIHMHFSAEGGKYFGHIMRGNRPSQHACRGEDHFSAFDWRIAIRTVKKGKGPMRVHLRVAQQTQGSQQPLPLHASHCPHKELLP